jgi:flagellar hook assembly protein FlgD
MSDEAWFGFDLPHGAPVSLEIFDLAGRRVATLASGERGAGRYQLRWTGMNESGGRVQAGLYFVRFATPGLQRVERIVRLP